MCVEKIVGDLKPEHWLMVWNEPRLNISPFLMRIFFRSRISCTRPFLICYRTESAWFRPAGGMPIVIILCLPEFRPLYWMLTSKLSTWHVTVPGGSLTSMVPPEYGEKQPFRKQADGSMIPLPKTWI